MWRPAYGTRMTRLFRHIGAVFAIGQTAEAGEPVSLGRSTTANIAVAALAQCAR
jgi:hypothetical protein